MGSGVGVRVESQYVMPVERWNSPEEHAVHSPAPVALLYECAGHSLHATSPGPAYRPTPHASHPTAPVALEYWPAGQSGHELCLDLSLYLPAAQLVQLAEEGPLYAPEGHGIGNTVPVPTLQYLPAAHGSQRLMPVVPWYLPAGHAKHAFCCPATGKYRPAAHATHVPPGTQK